MRTPEEVQKEIEATGSKLRKLRRELQFAERFRSRRGWVGIRRADIYFILDEEVVFPVSGDIIWLEWYGFIARDEKLAVAFSTTSGQEWRYIDYGEKLKKFMTGATIGFFATEEEARQFVEKKTELENKE